MQLIGTVEAVQYARRLVLDSVRSKMASMGCYQEGFVPSYPTITNSMEHSPLLGAWPVQPPTYANIYSDDSWGTSPSASPPEQPVEITEMTQSLALVQPAKPAAATTNGIKLVRQISSRILVHLPHAAWCLLKDRVAMMAEFRLAVSRMYDVIQQQDRAKNYGIKFGKRTRSWAHFVLEKPEAPDAGNTPSAVQIKVQNPCNTQQGFRLQRASSEVNLASREPQVAVPVC